MSKNKRKKRKDKIGTPLLVIGFLIIILIIGGIVYFIYEDLRKVDVPESKKIFSPITIYVGDNKISFELEEGQNG